MTITTISTTTESILHLTLHAQTPSRPADPFQEHFPHSLELTAEEKIAVQDRLAALKQEGLRAKIRSLLHKLPEHSLLSKEALRQWLLEFVTIEDAEGMALSFAVLILTIIRPSLDKTEDHADIIELEDLAEDIIHNLLPEEDTKAFLEDCDDGLREKALVDERYKQLGTALQAQRAAFAKSLSMIEAHTQEAFNRLIGRLIDLEKELTEEIHNIGDRTLGAAQELETLKTTIVHWIQNSQREDTK